MNEARSASAIFAAIPPCVGARKERSPKSSQLQAPKKKRRRQKDQHKKTPPSTRKSQQAVVLDLTLFAFAD